MKFSNTENANKSKMNFCSRDKAKLARKKILHDVEKLVNSNREERLSYYEDVREKVNNFQTVIKTILNDS
jgi:hypothetical protein